MEAAFNLTDAAAEQIAYLRQKEGNPALRFRRNGRTAYTPDRAVLS